jgi:hypothetical protein
MVHLAVFGDGDASRTALRLEAIRPGAAVRQPVADKLAAKALELEARRTALKQKYYTRLKAALSATTAAKFLQVENQLLMIIDLQIAASLPIVK